MIVNDNEIIFDELISASSPNSEGRKIVIDVIKPFQARNSKGGFCQFDNVEDLHSSAKLSAINYKVLK